MLGRWYKQETDNHQAPLTVSVYTILTEIYMLSNTDIKGSFLWI